MITTMGGRAGRVGLGLGLAALLAVGCAGRGDNESDSAFDESVALEDSGAAAPDAAAEAPGGTGGDIAATEALDLVAADRDVIRTGSMRITVDEVDDAVDEVRAIATAAGGFVADEQVRVADDTADVTVSVPTDDFDDVRTSLGELGDVTEQDVQAQDVTADMVDLESRIASLRASVERMRGLLAEAGDVTQLATVEGELASRETELEALLGQQRVLADQVALGTLTVHLGEEAPPAPDEDDDAAGFTDGFRNGWEALIDGGRVVLAVIGFMIPFALPVGVVLAAVLVWQRRRPGATPVTEPHP
jgi:hypothetical protein